MIAVSRAVCVLAVAFASLARFGDAEAQTPDLGPSLVSLKCNPEQPANTPQRIVVVNLGPAKVPKGTIVTIKYLVDRVQPPSPTSRPAGPGQPIERTLSWIAPIEMPVTFAIGTDVFGSRCVSATYPRLPVMAP